MTRPAGQLADALAPLDLDGYDVVTRVADRLGDDLCATLAGLIRAAKVAAVVRANTPPSVVHVDDDSARAARRRIGYLSMPGLGTVAVEADPDLPPDVFRLEVPHGVEVAAGRPTGRCLCGALSGHMRSGDPAPLTPQQLLEHEDRAARYAEGPLDDLDPEGTD